jgi:hypothetical protein
MEEGFSFLRALWFCVAMISGDGVRSLVRLEPGEIRRQVLSPDREML